MGIITLIPLIRVLPAEDGEGVPPTRDTKVGKQSIGSWYYEIPDLTLFYNLRWLLEWPLEMWEVDRMLPTHLYSSWKASRLIPYALKCALYWWTITILNRWYIYNACNVFKGGNMTLNKSKSSQRMVGKSFISLGIFPSGNWKSYTFPPAYFLSRPLFFFPPVFLLPFFTNHYSPAGLFTTPKWLATTWLNPSTLLVIFKLGWVLLAASS